MKYPLVLVPLLGSCVTSADLRAVADSLARVEETVADETKSTVEVKAEIAAAKEDIAAVADQVDERTDSFLDGLTDPELYGPAGLLSIVLGVGINAYRNRTRQRALAGAPAEKKAV